MSEFRYNPDLKIGDEVEVYIESQEDKKDNWIFSHKKARYTFCDRVLTRLFEKTKYRWHQMSYEGRYDR